MMGRRHDWILLISVVSCFLCSSQCSREVGISLQDAGSVPSLQSGTVSSAAVGETTTPPTHSREGISVAVNLDHAEASSGNSTEFQGELKLSLSTTPVPAADADSKAQPLFATEQKSGAVAAGNTSAAEVASAPAAATTLSLDDHLAGELAVHLGEAAGKEPSLSRHRPEPGQPPGHGRQRPEPGLAPSESKPSSRRNGVPPLEMLEKTSKARTGVQDLDMLESQSKPRKGAPPPLETASNSSAGHKPTAAYSDGDESATSGDDGAPHWDATRARAHTSVIIAAVFAGGTVLCLGYFLFRRAADRWHHRHYRKMDFLVDGMYNL